MSQTTSLSHILQTASDTRALEIGKGALKKTPETFRQLFGNKESVIVADINTFAAAGKEVFAAFQNSAHSCREPFVYSEPDLYAEHDYVVRLEESLRQHDAIPVAVGSGTINDLTKLAAHRLNRPYVCVGTAASMDGYTAFGASITYKGSKQTFECPAPRAALADLDVICAAPKPMNAWGYADLLAKVTAGADWMLADALGAEPIHQQGWEIIQGRLRQLIGEPRGVRENSPSAIARLVEGLMVAGFAMQAARNSRAASGAEHQFSHLWDMQHHTHQGKAPSHGFKVGIGTLAVAALYEFLLNQPLEKLDIEACCSRWPDQATTEATVQRLFPEKELLSVAMTETRAKAVQTLDLRAQLDKLRKIWPDLKERLQRQLLPFAEIKSMLREAGAPVEPEEIGISHERLRQSFRLAYFTRRRFTILDLAMRTGLLDKGLEHIFGPTGPWPIKVESHAAVTTHR